MSQGKYEVEFPTLSTKTTDKAKSWGPIQAPWMSAKNAGDTRTILQKAQQFKDVQNMEVQKDPGKNPMHYFPF